MKEKRNKMEEKEMTYLDYIQEKAYQNYIDFNVETDEKAVLTFEEFKSKI
jgi:hypothetical protein